MDTLLSTETKGGWGSFNSECQFHQGGQQEKSNQNESNHKKFITTLLNVNNLSQYRKVIFLEKLQQTNKHRKGAVDPPLLWYITDFFFHDD